MPYSSEPPDWWSGVQASTVPLVVEFRLESGESQWMFASGFTIETGGRWFWVTADHVFHGKRYGCDGLDTLTPHFPIIEAHFAPSAEPKGKGVLVRFDPKYISGIPDIARHLAVAGIESDRIDFLLGLDIAIVELSPYYRDNLKACGVIPLVSEDIFREYDSEFIVELRNASRDGAFGFYVVGVPKSSLHVDPSGVVQLTQKRLPIKEESYANSEHQFTPLWTARSHTGSVKGMSGGPIFAIVGDRAYLYAVQSAEKCAGDVVKYLKGASAPFMCRVIEALAQLAHKPS